MESDFIIKGGILEKYVGQEANVVIPDGVVKIGDNAFLNTKITSVSIPSSVTEIGDYAFSNCVWLDNIIIPYGVTKIGMRAFCNCVKFNDITLPDSVTEIGGLAFSFCIRLKSIYIPDSVTKIGEGAFVNCPALRDIKIPDIAEIERDTFALSDNVLVNYRGNTYTQANIKELYTAHETKTEDKKPNMSKYSGEPEGYTLEFEDVIFCWDEQPDDNYEEIANNLREAYVRNIRRISEEIYAEIKDLFDIKDIDEVIAKLGKPQIYPDNGQVVYCENSFDNLHIISFEYSDDEFNEIEYISIDG